jgi:hypothetical protein
LEEAKRDSKNLVLKTKAAAKCRLKEVEEQLALLDASSRQRIDQLQAENETVQSARDWAIEEIARVSEQLQSFKLVYIDVFYLSGWL